MIIIIVVTVILAVYEIVNSVMFNNVWKALPGKHQNIIEYLTSAEDEGYRNEQINYAKDNDYIQNTRL